MAKLAASIYTTLRTEHSGPFDWRGLQPTKTQRSAFPSIGNIRVMTLVKSLSSFASIATLSLSLLLRFDTRAVDELRLLRERKVMAFAVR